MKDEKNLQDELMTDEELEQVAGGSYKQTAQDSVILHSLGFLDEEYTAEDIMFCQDWSKEVKVYDAFKKLGIGYSVSFSADNVYSFNGQKISRRKAYEIAWEKAGRNLNDLPPSWGI